MEKLNQYKRTILDKKLKPCLTGSAVTELWERWTWDGKGSCSSPGGEHSAVFLSKTLLSHSASLHPGVLSGCRWIVGKILKRSVQRGEGGGGGGGGGGGLERLISKFRESSNIPARFSLKKLELSREMKLYIFFLYLDLARPWASSSTVGTPRRTNLVKRDCSMLENFWKAMFLITGGSYKRRKNSNIKMPYFCRNV